MTQKITPLVLTAMAAVPLSTVWIATTGPLTADAAAKKAATPTAKKPTPKPTTTKTSTHKGKKKPAASKPKPTATKLKPAPTATPKPTATPTDTPVPASGTFAGPTVQERFGTVQVSILVSGKKITDVKETDQPDTARSQFINQRAMPILRQEVLKAQSATIDTVSGATYTSDAYIRSLQAAVSKAGL